jgi:hypothetical protein
MSSTSTTRSPRPAAFSVGLKEILRTLACLVVLPWGLLSYAVTGKTSGKAYQAFIWMFCVTGGRSNAFLSWIASRLRPAKRIDNAVGVLGDLSGPASGKCVEKLRRDGYVVFERALSPAVCDRLLEFARTTPSKIRRMDGEAPTATVRTAVFGGTDPVAVRYDYDPATLLDNEDVQNLLADRSLLRLAQEYLGSQPVADVLSMWWHTNHHSQPDSEAAQYYHFDMDRIKWFKVFIYLTDVGPQNGPHSFVVGSQRSGGIPWHLRRKGYVRLMDDEVAAEYGSERCLHLTAPRGSIIVEDTSGLHKGNTVQADPRLILQLQFSNSLFGGYYPPARITRIQSPELQSRLREMPEVYRQYA